MDSLNVRYAALVVGATGGIGAAFVRQLRADPRCGSVTELSRADGLDLGDERTVEAAAQRLAGRAFDLIVIATGVLAPAGGSPEKTIRALDPAAMAEVFAVNAIGPAILLKHLAPLLPRDRRAIVGVLSARVGSIGDNRLGGWISYRASKAALNQIVRTASIEIARRNPQALVAALHPGTVATDFSARFADGRERLLPDESAARLLATMDAMPTSATGGFHAYDGTSIDW